MALFVVASEEVGAVYLTVTAWPTPIVGVIDSTTVDPLACTLLTGVRTLPTYTSNALVGAVVVDNSLLYVRIKLLPAEFTIALARIGLISGVTAFDAEDAADVASMLVAVAVNVYVEPLVSPVTMHDPEEPVTVQDLPDSSTAEIVK